MALAGALTWAGHALLAPFRIHGTALRPNVLLIAKLIVVGLICKGYHRQFPDVFAPLLPVFEWIPAPYWRHALDAAFAIAAAALMFNRAVRTSCVILGLVFIVATLSSRVYYRNANFFVGVIFLLIGLQGTAREPTLLAWQLGLMYLLAGVNKFLDPDWRSGQYFANFLANIYQSDFYIWASARLPENWFALYLSWHVIVSEIVAGVMFFAMRLRRFAAWLAAGMHAGAAVLVAYDYGIYVAAVLASYLIVLDWPRDLRVRWNGHASAALVALHRLSHGWDRSVRYEYTPGPTLQLTVDGRSHEGFAAFWRLALWTPALYFLAMAVFTGAEGGWNRLLVRASGAAIMVLLAVAAIAWLRRRPAG